MKRVLIVSPFFPPMNAADMHRVRLSLPHFEENGWTPRVLGVDPAYLAGPRDPLLERTVPAGLPVHRVPALRSSWTGRVGLGSVALRSWPYLAATGSRLIRRHDIDLVYFSTTEFMVMTLGPLWRRRHGVPFVVDIQDLWRPHADTPPSHDGGKHAAMRRLHSVMERWTLTRAAGVLTVSPDYATTLRSRYGVLADRPVEVLPFGAADADFDLLASAPQPNRVFEPGDGCWHGVYAGRGGADMGPALRALFAALAAGLRSRPELFRKIRLHFVGTSYATPDRATKTVEPLAREAGVAAHVSEQVERIPYFEALQILRDADFLVLPGSSDSMYSPSKLYPYVLARRPLLGIVAKGGPAADLLRRLGRDVVQLEGGAAAERDAATVLRLWTALLERLGQSDPPSVDAAAFAPFTARETTRVQCRLLDRALAASRDRELGVAAVTGT